jgi:hypothetical protein
LERHEKYTPIPQPLEIPSDKSAGIEESPIPSPVAKEIGSRLQDTHRNMQAAFTESRGAGLVRDRDHVAGFAPHAFTDSPSAMLSEHEPKPVIERLELVSMLKHKPPRVYVSQNMPNMEELRNAPTRPLDVFEKRSLAELTKHPSHLVAEPVDGKIRMLGAILTIEQCRDCHRTRVGEMLGAFSYEVRLKGAAQKPPTKTVGEKIL